MCQQLNRLYGINRHSEQPFHLYMTGFNKEKELYEMCVDTNQGFEKYKVSAIFNSVISMFIQYHYFFNNLNCNI